MTDGSALLRAILTAPEDDAPRLVYADWCDENGESERAEFIRVQCELDSWRGPRPFTTAEELVADAAKLTPETASRLESRERELIHNTVFWGVDCPFPAHPNNGRCVWRRGFLDTITLSAADWLAHHAALAWHPAHCPHDMPATAQPLTRVVLTTDWPDGAIEHVKSGIGYKYGWYQVAGEVVRIREHVLGVSNWDAAVAARWPWLVVELPPESPDWVERLPGEPETRFHAHGTARVAGY